MSDSPDLQKVPASQLGITPHWIAPSAHAVLKTLNEGGYQAFLVGGAIRDAMLGREPKDFDVVTDARPNQVRDLFRRCRLVGRRFRLAHVRVGRDIIEVATFRADPNQLEQAHSGHRLSEDGQIERDNVYGTIEEDVWRRDFSVNALYYDFADKQVWDYVGGIADVKAGRLRLIGDPATRLKEDPVRMLRAVRFAAKLGLTFNEGLPELIRAQAEDMSAVSAARLFDEMLKVFHSGYAQKADEQVQSLGLFSALFPDAEISARHQAMWQLALASTDERIAQGKTVTPAFLLAVLYWGRVHGRLQNLRKMKKPPMEAAHQAVSEVVGQVRRMTIPRRFSLGVRDIVTLQHRLYRTRGKRCLRVLSHPRFRAAYDFLWLRAKAGELPEDLPRWWQTTQRCSQAEQNQRVDPKHEAQPKLDTAAL